MKVAVCHPGTQHSWQTATALQRLGLLEFYGTSIFYQPDRWPYVLHRYLPGSLGRWAETEFRRFEHPALDPALVKTGGIYEWLERIAKRTGHAKAAAWFDDLGNRSFSRAMVKEVNSDRPFAVWGYNNGALEIFDAARKAGRMTILDRTIGDWRAYNEVMGGVFETHAEWFTNPDFTIPESVIARNEAEYETADFIVCGSEQCAATVRQYALAPGVDGKLRVLPYCFDETLFAAAAPPAPSVDKEGPVRFLFIGLVSMRKGIHHLLEAISRIPRSEAELTLVGKLEIPDKIFARYQDRVTYLPNVPRSEIPAIMRRHDALVFPSYFEGSALSLLEALASGLALIHTPQAGNGVTEETGILLSKPDTELTLAAMRDLVADRERLAYYRSNARREAENYTFT